MPRGVQSQVNGLPAPAVAGDFASSNWNRYSTLSGPSGLVAGPAGVTVGAFGWLSQSFMDPDNAPTIVNSFASYGGAPDGFVSRPDSPSTIVAYLADASMIITGGQPVPLHSSGDFWVINNSAAAVTMPPGVQQKVFASLTTGLATGFGATGTAQGQVSGVTGDVTVAAGTWSATGSIAGNVMTVGTVTGTQGLPIGATVTGGGATGVVVAQLSGPARGAGTYALSVGEQTIASGTSLSGTFGILSVVTAAPTGGTIQLGALVAGTGIPAGSIITDTLANGNTALTGAGLLGTYVTNLTGTGGSGVVTFTTTVETGWYARSAGAVGEPIKISNTLQ